MSVVSDCCHSDTGIGGASLEEESCHVCLACRKRCTLVPAVDALMPMSAEEKQAYQWAIDQHYQSVAAPVRAHTGWLSCPA